MCIVALLPPLLIWRAPSHKKRYIARMRIGTSSCLFGSSTVLASGLYFRERSSTLYTVITASEAVEVSDSAAGRAVIVELGLAAGRAARVDQLQQSSKVLVQLREVYRSRGRVAVRCQRQMVDSRRIGTIGLSVRL